MKSLILILAFFLNPLFVLSQTIVWDLTSQTLVGNVNVVYATTDGKLFAGTLQQGIYFSSNNGENWVQKNNGLADLNVFSFLEVGSNIFCGTLGGIYKSSNLGDNWELTNNGLTDTYINTLAITKDNKLLAGTLYSGLFISNDFGASWTQMQNNFSNKSVNCILSKSDGFVFVGTTSGLYRSTYLFDFWGKVDTDFKSNNNINTLAQDSSGNLYAGTNNGMIFKSTNNGVNWTKVFEISGSSIYRIVVSSNNSIFVATWGSGILRSIDEGLNWEYVNDGLFNPYITSILYLPSRFLFASSWGNGVFIGKEFEISTFAEGEYCAGAEILVKYQVTQTFEQDNVFIAQLSDNYGKFVNPIEIGRINSNTSGTINARIPQNASSGILYRVRVVSTNPFFIGADNRKNIKVFRGLNPSISGPASVCNGDVKVYSTPVKPGVISQWFVTNGEIISIDDSNMTVTIKWLSEGIGRIKLRQSLAVGGCDDSTSILIQIHPVPPKPNITRNGYVLFSSSKTGNQWYFFDKPIDGANSDSLVVDTPGLYYVQVTSENGCVSELSDPFDFYYYSVENSLDNGFELFPSPVRDKLILASQNPFKKIEIFNFLGKRVLSVDCSINTFRTEIDLSQFPEGLYNISVSTFSTFKGILIKKFVILR